MSHAQKRGGAVRRRTVLAGAGALGAAAAFPLRFANAQGQALKIGVLLPRSGIQAQLGIDAGRGADLAAMILPPRGFPPCTIVAADTETQVPIARAQAEKLIEQGCHVIVGCYDSGQTVAVAQVCEARGIPLVVNIAAVPNLTEQGFKTVFRNFPSGATIAVDTFGLQKELFQLSGPAPKTAVLLHANDTFGASQRDVTVKLIEKFAMPYKFVDTVGYDPNARDLSAEVRKAKATNAELVWCISRVNDGILAVREMVKQRWQPMGVINTGPGWAEEPFVKALGKLADDIVSVLPWYDPKKPMAQFMVASWTKNFPGRFMTLGVLYTFEAVLIALDACKRAGSTESAKLLEALRKTDIKDNATVGTGVHFDAKGQNPDTKSSLIQVRAGKPAAIVPAAAADAKPIWPMRPWDKR
ncbi:MAG TPA: ABC transporter substrate-binding protein [Alphaproteobacteria bacterium]|jgi:branched-chain amino acid transport system substrate-binding protein